MASIRRSNRVAKPIDYWDPTNSPPHQRHPPAFTIYTESSKHPPEHPPEHLPEHLSEHLLEGPEDLLEGLSEGLSTEFFDEDLSFELSDEDLSSEFDEALSEDEALSKDEALSAGKALSKDEVLSKDKDLSKHLSRQLHEDLGMNSSYQSQFLSKNRADKSQNLSENSNSFKLFQLFFTVKEIENIVKQINQ